MNEAMKIWCYRIQNDQRYDFEESFGRETGKMTVINIQFFPPVTAVIAFFGLTEFP